MRWFWSSLNRLLESLSDWIYWNRLGGGDTAGALVGTEMDHISRVVYVDEDGNEVSGACVSELMAPPQITWTNLPKRKPN